MENKYIKFNRMTSDVMRYYMQVDMAFICAVEIRDISRVSAVHE